MLLSFLKKNFYLHELIIIPAFIGSVGLSWYFSQNYNWLPPFAEWVMLIALMFFIGFVCVKIATVGIKLFFKSEIAQNKFNYIKTFRFIRIFFAIFVLLIIYENLQLIIPSIAPTLQDPALLYYDELLFGFYPTDPWIMNLANVYLTEIMNAVYLTFYFYIPIIALLLYVQNSISEALRFTLVMVIAFLIAFGLYILVPGIGPLYYLKGQFPVELDGTLVNLVQGILQTSGIPRNVFPSLHVAGSAIPLYFFYKNSKPLFIVCLPVIILLWLSTVYLRLHYIIDVFAGWFLAIVCIALGTYLFTKWNEKTLVD